MPRSCPKRARIPAVGDIADNSDTYRILIPKNFFPLNTPWRIRLTGSPAIFREPPICVDADMSAMNLHVSGDVLELNAQPLDPWVISDGASSTHPDYAE
jgi:hypothetical protein